MLGRNQAKAYPEDIQRVLDSTHSLGALYIGNKEAAQNLATLTSLGINCVLSAAKGLILTHPKNKISQYKYVPADDHESFDLSVYFDQASDFIREARKGGNILVHCMAGVSRSVSLVIAYLIREQGMSYQQAYDTIKARRRIISPNDGFIAQLRKYQQRARRTRTTSVAVPISVVDKYQSSIRRFDYGQSSQNYQLKEEMLKQSRRNDYQFLSRTRRYDNFMEDKTNLSSNQRLGRSGVRLGQDQWNSKVSEINQKIDQLRRKYLGGERARTSSAFQRSQTLRY